MTDPGKKEEVGSDPAEPPSASSGIGRKFSWRLALWFVLLLGLIAWGASQPPTRLEPVDWVGTLDI